MFPVSWKMIFFKYLEKRSSFQGLRIVIRGNVMVTGNVSYLLCPYQGCYILEIETICFILVSPNQSQCLAQYLRLLRIEGLFYSFLYSQGLVQCLEHSMLITCIKSLNPHCSSLKQCYYYPYYQMWKRRHREIKSIAQNYQAN